jgi:hypothetical protein
MGLHRNAALGLAGRRALVRVLSRRGARGGKRLAVGACRRRLRGSGAVVGWRRVKRSAARTDQI